MSAELPDSDLEKLASQLAAITKAPIDDRSRAQMSTLAASLLVLAHALEAPADDTAARARIADEIDRARTTTLAAVNTASPQVAQQVPLAALTGALDLVARWLRSPKPETTAAVERLVDALRAIPGGEALWTDQAADAKREAELDANVQKSLDEIAAGMPKFKL